MMIDRAAKDRLKARFQVAAKKAARQTEKEDRVIKIYNRAVYFQNAYTKWQLAELLAMVEADVCRHMKRHFDGRYIRAEGSLEGQKKAKE